MISIGAALLVLVSAGDYLSHVNYVLEFSPFYLVPISFFSWFIGKSSGITVGMLGTMIGFFIRLREAPRAIAYWDALVWFTLYVSSTFIVAELRRLYEHERQLSRVDPLTRIGNRRAFFEAAASAKNWSDRQNVPLSISYIDLDRFKELNDRFGHSMGDRVLAVTAATIAKAVRPSDFVARIGGDELAVLLPATNDEGAAGVLRRAHSQLDRAMAKRGWPVTFSIGIASFSPPLGSVSEMINAADKAMYIAGHRIKE